MSWFAYFIIAYVVTGWISMFLARRIEEPDNDFKIKDLFFVVFVGGFLGVIFVIIGGIIYLNDYMEGWTNKTLIKSKSKRERIRAQREIERERHHIPDDVFRIR